MRKIFWGSKFHISNLGILFGLIFLSACGGGGGGSSSTTDTTAPTVSSTSPANGSTGISISTTITATFSESMDSSTITTSTISVSGGVTGTVTYDSTNKVATFTPSANLSYSTTYTVTITTGVKDSAGNAMAGNYTWSFTTTAVATVVTDIDGNVYNTVTIGTQVWMKENLKVTKYLNGDVIPTTTADIRTETSPKYQWAYNGSESNVATYGRLYTWYAATDSRGVCPTGWHLPTDAEWTTLTSYLEGETVAGGKMKEAGTTHWNSPNTSADNSSGWTALPGGFSFYDGTFSSIGDLGYWWSATEGSAADAWYRGMSYADGYVLRINGNKNFGFSVRCIRD